MRMQSRAEEDAFRALTEAYRRELHVHIYRIVGSTDDAEDLLQETLLAAWRGLEQFEGRASVRAWLYRIATNRSLDALRATRRRPDEQQMSRLPEPTRWNEPVWLQPYPDALLDGIPDEAPGPEARYETREAIALASSSACSICRPSSERCWCCATCSATAPARSPRCSTPARRRPTACCDGRAPRSSRACRRRDATARRCRTPGSSARSWGASPMRSMSGDVDGMVAVLTDDAWLTMPPLPHAYQGRDAIRAFLLGAEQRRGAPVRMVATRANGDPAFGCYLTAGVDASRPLSIVVLSLQGAGVSAITWFADSSGFAQFGLPPVLR